MIGSKGGWKLSTIFLSCKVFHNWSIINLGNISYFLDGYIFTVLFGTASYCFCWLSLLVWLRKKDFAFWYFISVEFSSQGPKSGKTWWSLGYLILVLLIELGPICNSMAASLWLKSCEDHSLLKSYNGGLWKNNYRSGPLRRISGLFCWIPLLLCLWPIICFWCIVLISASPIMISAFKKSTF